MQSFVWVIIGRELLINISTMSFSLYWIVHNPTLSIGLDQSLRTAVWTEYYWESPLAHTVANLFCSWHQGSCTGPHQSGAKSTINGSTHISARTSHGMLCHATTSSPCCKWWYDVQEGQKHCQGEVHTGTHGVYPCLNPTPVGTTDIQEDACGEETEAIMLCQQWRRLPTTDRTCECPMKGAERRECLIRWNDIIKICNCRGED